MYANHLGLVGLLRSMPRIIIYLKKPYCFEEKKKEKRRVNVIKRRVDVRGNRVNSSSIWEIRKTNHFINISEHLNSKALSKQGAIKRQ